MRAAFWRRRKGPTAETPTEASHRPAPGAAAPAAAPAARAQPPATAAGTQPGAPADAHQRIDGLRAWLAQVDRKLGIRTYALGAAAVLGLAAGIVGIVLALGFEEDSAKQEDLRGLRDQIAAVERDAQAEAEQGVQSVTERVDQLETDLSRLDDEGTTTADELSVVQDDIRDLRSQISDLESGGAGGP
jgi:uncharacterized protein HemX